MNKTSLFEKHQELNAKMADFAGWQMPIQYTSVKEETLAVRNNVGMFDVSHMGEFFVEGEQTYQFLNYLLPNEIEKSPMGKAIYAPLCRDNGTIIDDLIVYKLEVNKALICVNASNIDKDFNWMKEKVKDFNCSLVNHSQKYSLLALQGPKAQEILEKSEILFPKEYYSCEQNKEMIIARTGYTGEDGFEIFASHDEIKLLWDKFMGLGVIPCGLAARDVLRLEVCYPLYGHELNDDVTPLESNLKWTVKMDKKGFIGKEAFIDFKPKSQLIKLILDKGIPRQGYKVLDKDNNEIGEVTSGTMSVILGKGIAIARILVNKYPKDDVFKIQIRNQTYLANKVIKAFVSGGHK